MRVVALHFAKEPPDGWIRRAETLTAPVQALELPPTALQESFSRW